MLSPQFDNYLGFKPPYQAVMPEMLTPIFQTATNFQVHTSFCPSPKPCASVAGGPRLLRALAARPDLMQGLGQELQTADVADLISELASPVEGVLYIFH